MPRPLPQGLFFSIVLACCSPAPRQEVVRREESAPNLPVSNGGLDVVVRGRGEHAVVLMHGYGARGDDLVPLGERLAARVDARFVMPAAPFVRPHGSQGRMWFERDGPRALQQAAVSARAIDGVVDTLRREGASRIVLAGFSQGAMMSLERGLRAETRPAALVLFSGAAPQELGEDWSSLDGMPIFISHGRSDDILPFERGRDIARRAEAAGAQVVFVPFDGGHTIPSQVVERAGLFLEAVFSS